MATRSGAPPPRLLATPGGSRPIYIGKFCVQAGMAWANGVVIRMAEVHEGWYLNRWWP